MPFKAVLRDGDDPYTIIIDTDEPICDSSRVISFAEDTIRNSTTVNGNKIAKAIFANIRGVVGFVTLTKYELRFKIAPLFVEKRSKIALQAIDILHKEVEGAK